MVKNKQLHKAKINNKYIRKKQLFKRRALIIFTIFSIMFLFFIICISIYNIVKINSENVSKNIESEIVEDSYSFNLSDTTIIETTTQIASTAIYDYQNKYPELYCQPPSNVQYTNKIYLTFDDGPSNLTETNLDILKQNNVKATFFVVGSYAENRKEVLKRIVDEGHSIGIHTYSHKYKEIYESVESFLDDFAKTYNIIYDATGIAPNIYRFPGGSNTIFNEDIRTELIKEMDRRGFTYFDWNVSSEDATGQDFSAEEIENNVVSNLHINGESIVLMHDLNKQKSTSMALKNIIKSAKQNGYEFDSLNNNVGPVQFFTLD